MCGETNHELASGYLAILASATEPIQPDDADDAGIGLCLHRAGQAGELLRHRLLNCIIHKHARSYTITNWTTGTWANTQ